MYVLYTAGCHGDYIAADTNRHLRHLLLHRVDVRVPDRQR